MIQLKSWIYQIKEATKFLHSINIVNLDLKIENIMLNKKFKIKVIDFGFSLVIENEIIENKKVGTRGYWAPEIFEDD